MVNNEVLVSGTVALNPLGNGVKVLNNLTDAGFFRAADNPALQPFQASILMTCADGTSFVQDTGTAGWNTRGQVISALPFGPRRRSSETARKWAQRVRS